MSRIAKLLLPVALVVGLTPMARAQVKLERKGFEGKTLTKESTSKIHQILNIAGQEVETDVEVVVTTSLAMGKRGTGDVIPITVKTEALRANMNLPGGMNISFDSAAPPAKDDSPLGFVIDLFRALVGSSYTVNVNDKGEAVSVEGTDKVLDKARELNPMAADLMKGDLDPERIKGNFKEEMGQLPDILVRPGDTWTRTEHRDIGSGQVLEFEKKYEYLGTVEKDGKTLDKLGVKATAVKYSQGGAGADQGLKVEKSDLKVDSSEGTLLFDREAGVFVEAQTVDRIKGTMTMAIMGQTLNADLDLTLDSLETSTLK